MALQMRQAISKGEKNVILQQPGVCTFLRNAMSPQHMRIAKANAHQKLTYVLVTKAG